MLLLVLGCAACSDAAPERARGEPTPFPNRRAPVAGEGLLGYVANRMSDSISVIELDTMQEIARAPLGRDPVDVDGPRHVLLDEANALAYVALSYPLVSDSPHAAANAAAERAGYLQVLALDDLRPVGELRLAPRPGDMALSDDGRALLVPHYDTLRAQASDDLEARRADLALIAPPSEMTAGTATLRNVKACVAPAAVVFGASVSRAFVACTGEDALVVIDAGAGVVLSRVPAGELAANKPFALARDRAGSRLALSNQVARSVVVFSMEDEPRVLAAAYLAGVPAFAGWLSDGRLLVPEQDPDGVVEIDPATGALLRETWYSPAECENPGDVAESADGRLFAVCEGDRYRPGAVVRLDRATLEVVASASVGLYPDRISFREASP